MNDASAVTGPAASVGATPTSSAPQNREGDPLQVILARARGRVQTSDPGYAGNVTPQEAWELVCARAAVLVDVRTLEEWQFVGRIEDSIHVPWMTGTALQRNPEFVRELQAKVCRDEVLLLICRSGNRSATAAKVLTEERFSNVFNVLQGFEGELDDHRHRGNKSGWRFHQLPWVQG